jgi:hypothetical protein
VIKRGRFGRRRRNHGSRYRLYPSLNKNLLDCCFIRQVGTAGNNTFHKDYNSLSYGVLKKRKSCFSRYLLSFLDIFCKKLADSSENTLDNDMKLRYYKTRSLQDCLGGMCMGNADLNISVCSVSSASKTNFSYKMSYCKNESAISPCPTVNF